MRIKPITASRILTVNQRQTHMLKIRATGTRHQLETHMDKRVAARTHSKRLYRADMEVKLNNKLPTAVGTDKGRIWAMEVMVS